jgi:hypothetical protein
MEAGAAGSGGTATASPPAAAEKTRRYGVFTETTIDLTAEPAAILEQLKAIVGVDGKGEPIPTAVALVRIGRADEEVPRKALEAVAQFRDLKGDFEVIADSARNSFKDVSSQVRRVVSIG